MFVTFIMAFVSITRLRLRSFFYLFSFMVHASRSTRQLVTSSKFIKGKTLLDRKLTFWTMTLWNSEEDMRAYRNTEFHKAAMPKLQNWCDEASIAHWTQEDDAFPPWDEAWQRMKQSGRISKVKHPTEDHAGMNIPAPLVRPNMERILKPKMNP
jgi:hypothetical protein